MIKLIKLQCPNCGASLDVDSSLKTCFCQYCGTKILIHNENEKIIRKVDEAKIRQAELEHDLEVRRMDKAQEDAEIQRDIAMAQAQGEQNVRERVALVREENKKSRKRKRLISFAIFFVLGIVVSATTGMIYAVPLALVSWLVYILKMIPREEDTKAMSEAGLARFPKDLGNIQEQDCSYIVSSLEMSGFTHISTKNLHDGKRRLFSGGNLNKVERITLNGKPPKRGTLYPEDVPVIVTYHGE